MQPKLDLARVDQYPVPTDSSEVRLFCKFRNEALRLPYFLSYYRELGVRRFFFVDNASSDNSLAVLERQKDCHIFSTRQKMSEARAGMDWLEPLLHLYGRRQWCLVADADELLVYPGSESTPLPDFCGALDDQKVDALICMMLDMYPEGKERLSSRPAPFSTGAATSTGRNLTTGASRTSSAGLN